MATLMFIVELFIVDNFIGFLIAAVALGIIIGLSKVPVSFIVRGLKPIMIILVFTFALNMFMVDGRILWQADCH
jgi:energy-coupling factor transport system permease protein